MRFYLFFMLIGNLLYGMQMEVEINEIEFSDEFKLQKLSPCTAKIQESCTIVFSAHKSDKKLKLKEFILDKTRKIGQVAVYIDGDDYSVSKLDISYYTEKESVFFLMDSFTRKSYREKGLNNLLRKHYIDKFINKIPKLGSKDIYIGSSAVSSKSDHILLKNGISRTPALEKSLKTIFDELSTNEESFRNKDREEQIRIIDNSKFCNCFGWEEAKKKNKSPWSYIYRNHALSRRELTKDEGFLNELTNYKKL